MASSSYCTPLTGSALPLVVADAHIGHSICNKLPTWLLASSRLTSLDLKKFPIACGAAACCLVDIGREFRRAVDKQWLGRLRSWPALAFPWSIIKLEGPEDSRMRRPFSAGSVQLRQQRLNRFVVPLLRSMLRHLDLNPASRGASQHATPRIMNCVLRKRGHTIKLADRCRTQGQAAFPSATLAACT